MVMTPSEIDSSEPIRQRAGELEKALNSVSATSGTIRGIWSALTTSYSSPEASTVHNAMNKPDRWAQTLKGHAGTMRAAFDAYADKLDELKARRDQLIRDIAAHEAAVAAAAREKVSAKKKEGLSPNSYAGPGGAVVNADVVGGLTADLAREANDLERRVEEFETDRENAQRECGNKLQATWGGPHYVPSDKTSINNPYTWGTSLDAKRDQTRTGKAPWGSPDIWRLALKEKNGWGAFRLLQGQGAWNSVVGSWKNLWELTGLGGDHGATAYKRSGLAKLLSDLQPLSTALTQPVLGAAMMGSEKGRQRYAESLETAEAIGKGAISYDTWSTDPVGTYGSFLPDVAGAAVSGGTGGAAKLSLKALGAVSPGTALKAARVLNVLDHVDGGAVSDIRKAVDIPHGSPDIRKLEATIDTLPHAKADGSGVIPAHPHTGPGPIENRAGGNHHTIDVAPRGTGGMHGDGRSPLTLGDGPVLTPKNHAGGAATPHEVAPRRAAPDVTSLRHTEQPDVSPARRAEQPNTGVDLPDGKDTTPPTSKAVPYDPDARVRDTIPTKDAPRAYTQQDVDDAFAKAPRNEHDQPVDHRNGRPLELTNSSGNRAWVMQYDPEAASWVAENRALEPEGLPATGEPNSYGYDENGDRLPYANHRPSYTKEQIKDVWDLSRNEQIEQIKNGELDLPRPGKDEIWVQKKDDAKGPDIHVDSEGGKWAKITWKKGQDREGLWDMGHVPGREYKNLREEYLSHRITEEEFLKEYRDPKNYRVEDPSRNRSHVDEW